MGAGLLLRGGLLNLEVVPVEGVGQVGEEPWLPISLGGVRWGWGGGGVRGGWTSSGGTGRLFRSSEMVLSLCPTLPSRAAASDESLRGALLTRCLG